MVDAQGGLAYAPHALEAREQDYASRSGARGAQGCQLLRAADEDGRRRGSVWG